MKPLRAAAQNFLRKVNIMPISQSRVIALVEAASDMLGRIDALRLLNRQDQPMQLVLEAYNVADRESPIAAETIRNLCTALSIRHDIIVNNLEPGQEARTTIAAEAGHFRRVSKVNERKALYQKAKRMENKDPYTGPKVDFGPGLSPGSGLSPARGLSPALQAEVDRINAEKWPQATAAPEAALRPVREDPAELERLRQSKPTAQHPDEEPLFKPQPAAPQTSVPGRKLDYGAIAHVPSDDELYAPPPAGPLL
jgi:hypothetical protein